MPDILLANVASLLGSSQLVPLASQPSWFRRCALEVLGGSAGTGARVERDEDIQEASEEEKVSVGDDARGDCVEEVQLPIDEEAASSAASPLRVEGETSQAESDEDLVALAVPVPDFADHGSERISFRKQGACKFC